MAQTLTDCVPLIDRTSLQKQAEVAHGTNNPNTERQCKKTLSFLLPPETFWEPLETIKKKKKKCVCNISKTFNSSILRIISGRVYVWSEGDL